MSSLFLAWSRIVHREDGLAPLLQLPVVKYEASGPAPLRYVTMGVRTVWMLARKRPERLMVMLPPFPLLLIAWAYAKVARVPIVLDFHSAVFESPKWKWALRPTLWFAKRSTLSVVHHSGYLDRVPGAVVLHEVFEADNRSRTDGGYVLVPASWHEDEPIREIYEAAERLELDFKITGRAPAGQLPPPNVTLTGYVSDEEYKSLLADCSVVLALTTRENTMQAGGYQAMAWHKPLVTSDTRVLREYFGDAAVYAGSIEDAVRTVWADREGFAERMAGLHRRLVEEYPSQVEPVRRALGLPPG